MFWIVGFIVCILFGISGIFFQPKTNNNRYKTTYPRRDWILGWVIAGVCFILVGFLVSTVMWQDQISKNNKIDNTYALAKVYEHKADSLVPEFKNALLVQYPQYEKEIFDSIANPEDVQVFLVKYPEIKASTTIMEYVKRINKLQSDIFDQEINRQKYIASNNTNKESPFAFGFLIPETHR